MLEILGSGSVEDAWGILSAWIFMLGLAVLILMAIYTVIVRWVFRVDEMVKYQKRTTELLEQIRANLREGRGPP
jgi:hypothetical protein